MDNLASAKGDIAGSLAALREPHLWVISLLYIGTFGSFIGFAGVFPKLIKDTFPEFSTFAVGRGRPVAGLPRPARRLARPPAGRPPGGPDRRGTDHRDGVRRHGRRSRSPSSGTLPLGNFWLFLVLFLLLFAASGIGNGSTYRMIPTVFALRAGGATPARTWAPSARPRRRSGLVSAIGAYGGFLIPQVLRASDDRDRLATPRRSTASSRPTSLLLAVCLVLLPAPRHRPRPAAR